MVTDATLKGGGVTGKRRVVGESARSRALIAVCFGTLLVTLDRAMVILALPTMGADIGPSNAARLIGIYLLVSGGLLIVGGRLSDVFGHRNVFVVAAMVFVSGSLACAMVSSPEFLALFRGIQALGGAVFTLGPTTLALSLHSEPANRARALGFATTVSWLSQSAGPFLGAIVLMATPNWHWIFWVDIPIGLVLLVVSLVYLPSGNPAPYRARESLVRSAVFAAGVLLCSYVISSWIEIHTKVGNLILLGGSGIAAVLLFLSMESVRPLLLARFELPRGSRFRLASAAAALMGCATYAAYLIYPTYLQLRVGYSPLQVATAMLPLTLLAALLGLGFSARLVAYLGARWAAAAGLILIGSGLALFSHSAGVGSLSLGMISSMILVGGGFGIAPTALFVVAMEGIAKVYAGVASGLYVTAYVIGGGLGITILDAISSLLNRQSSLIGSETALARSDSHQVISYIGAALAFAAAAITAVVLSPRYDDQEEVP